MKLSAQPELVDYGIQTEHSDMRAHVCVQAKRVYVYATKAGIAAIDKVKHKKKPAGQPGVEGITAWGYCVPPDDIPGCKWIPIPGNWITHSRLRIDPAMSTADKGDRATLIVLGLIKTGRLPLVENGSQIQQVKATALQVQGVDLQVSIDIQVKCDMPGGAREAGGTGNLYLQVQERNPLGLRGETAKDRRTEPHALSGEEDDDLIAYGIKELGGKLVQLPLLDGVAP